MEPTYLIGIHPPASVEAKIRAFQAEVVKNCGPVLGTTTEPHITLNLNRFPDSDLLDKTLANLCKTFPPVEITVDGLSTFPKTGPATVVFGYIKPNPLLSAIQERMAQVLAPLREGEHLREFLTTLGYTFTRAQVKTSEKYGYAYIGKGWQPHMTVAFLNDAQFENVGKKLLQKPLSARFVAREITLFSYNDAKQNWQPFRVYPLQAQ